MPLKSSDVKAISTAIELLDEAGGYIGMADLLLERLHKNVYDNGTRVTIGEKCQALSSALGVIQERLV